MTAGFNGELVAAGLNGGQSLRVLMSASGCPFDLEGQ